MDKQTPCINCGKLMDYEPEYCCAGNTYGTEYPCGCMGLPIEPPICSQECWNEAINRLPKEVDSNG